MADDEPKPTLDQVVEHASQYLEASFTHVDPDQVESSEDAQFWLCVFAYGVINAFVEEAGLTPAQVKEGFTRLIREFFDGWDDQDLDDLAREMAEASREEEFQNLMQEGAIGISEWEGDVEEPSAFVLADLLEYLEQLQAQEGELDDAEEDCGCDHDHDHGHDHDHDHDHGHDHGGGPGNSSGPSGKA